jgi:hypothetical protein
MIITKLQGGIGNQMFQYAAGRALSELHQTELKIDLSFFGKGRRRGYSLHPFNIKENISTPAEISALTYRKATRLERFLTRAFHLSPRHASTHIVENRYFRFHRKLFKYSGSLYLDGYWQSYSYFKDIEHIITQEFSVKTPQMGKNKELAEQMARCNSVSLHIRRGDYVSNPRTNKMHGTCPLDYYYKCIQLVSQEIKDLHFFIFSDDADWVRDNLNIDFPTVIVSHNGIEKDYEDIRLMSQCKHHIIANSTFSWWGAWLNPSKEKIVFAPKQWFADRRYDTRDLIPEGWKKI